MSNFEPAGSGKRPRGRPRKRPAQSTPRSLAKSNTKRVTIRDVSRLARVSRMTVSRFFSNPDLLLPATRSRVAQVVKRLSYVPDRMAGSLALRRSGFVALLLPSLTSSIFSAAAHGLTSVLRRASLQLLIGHTEYDMEEEERQIEQLLARRPEAIVVVGAHHTKRGRALLANAGAPVIELGDLSHQPIDVAVGFSNREAGRMAARFLMSFGYRNIAAIGAGRQGDRHDSRGEERLQAFKQSLRSAGLRTDLVIRHGGPPVSYAGGEAGLAAILAIEPQVEAVAAMSDLAAVGVMMECRRRSIDIPGQLAVLGYGDFDIAASMVPPLTTIAVDFEDLGRRAGETVLQLLDPNGKKSDVPRMQDIGLRVVCRGTTLEATPTASGASGAGRGGRAAV